MADSKGTGIVNYKVNQLKTVTRGIYSQNPPSSVWAATSPTSKAFAELSRAHTLLGAYGLAAGRG